MHLIAEVFAFLLLRHPKPDSGRCGDSLVTLFWLCCQFAHRVRRASALSKRTNVAVREEFASIVVIYVKDRSF